MAAVRGEALAVEGFRTEPVEAAHRWALRLILLQAMGITTSTMSLLGLAQGSGLLRLFCLVTAFALLLRRDSHIYPPPLTLIAYALLMVVTADLSATLGAPYVELGLLVATIAVYVTLAKRVPVNAFLAAFRDVVVAASLLSLVIYFGGLQPAEFVGRYAPNIFGAPPLSGLFPHKIEAGVIAVLAAIALATVPYRRASRTLMALALLATILLLSGSGSGMLLAGVAAAMLFVARFRPGTRLLMIVSAALLAGVLALVAGDAALGAAGSLTGRSETLTGRTDLWRTALNLFSEKPIFGWGYGSLFGDTGLLARNGMATGGANYVAPHFHNSYLQSLAESGVLGMGMLLLLAVTITNRLVHRDRHGALLALWVTVAIYATANHAFHPTQLGWLIICYASAVPLKAHTDLRQPVVGQMQALANVTGR